MRIIEGSDHRGVDWDTSGGGHSRGKGTVKVSRGSGGYSCFFTILVYFQAGRLIEVVV